MGKRLQHCGKLKKILTESRHTHVHQMRLLNALVWPLVLYGCESWILKKVDEERMDALEMKCLRLRRVSGTARKTKEWLLQTAGVEINLLVIAKERKWYIMDIFCGKEWGA